jgi:fucose permease
VLLPFYRLQHRFDLCGGLVRKFHGAQRLTALAAMGCGWVTILLASNASTDEGVLVGLFVFAAGITVLQVAQTFCKRRRNPVLLTSVD